MELAVEALQQLGMQSPVAEQAIGRERIVCIFIGIPFITSRTGLQPSFPHRALDMLEILTFMARAIGLPRALSARGPSAFRPCSDTRQMNCLRIPQWA